MAKEKVQFLQSASIIAMLLVLFSHTMASGITYPIVLTKIITHSSIPALGVFFLISGYFATGYSKYGFSKYFQKRALRLLLPFFAIQIIMLLPKKIIGGGTLSLIDFLFAFINPRDYGITPHLWFTATLFAISFFIPLFEIIFKSKNRNVFYYLILVVLFAVNLLNLKITNFIYLNDILYYSFYFALGYGINKFKIFDLIGKKTWILVLLSLAAYVLALAIQFKPLETLGGTFAILGVSKCIFDKESFINRILGDNTFIVYLLSVCVQNLFEVIFVKMSLHWSLTIIISFAVGLLIPLFISLIIRAINEKIKIPKILLAIVGL